MLIHMRNSFINYFHGQLKHAKANKIQVNSLQSVRLKYIRTIENLSIFKIHLIYPYERPNGNFFYAFHGLENREGSLYSWQVTYNANDLFVHKNNTSSKMG